PLDEHVVQRPPPTVHAHRHPRPQQPPRERLRRELHPLIGIPPAAARPSSGSSSRKGPARTPGSGSSPSRSPPFTRRVLTRNDGLTACLRARRAWGYNQK